LLAVPHNASCPLRVAAFIMATGAAIPPQYDAEVLPMCSGGYDYLPVVAIALKQPSRPIPN